MPVGISRGYEPGRTLLQLPITYIGGVPVETSGSKYRTLSQDESDPEVRNACAALSEACAELTLNHGEVALKMAEEARAIFPENSEGNSDATRVLMVALADVESRPEAIRIGEASLVALSSDDRESRRRRALVLQSLAEIAAFRCRGDLRTKAVAWGEEAVQIQKDLGDKVMEGYVRSMFGGKRNPWSAKDFTSSSLKKRLRRERPGKLSSSLRPDTERGKGAVGWWQE
eukprot:Skav224063  [mRNA]  locus=scaffold534:592023:599440:- [translate_table: standard]